MLWYLSKMNYLQIHRDFISMNYFSRLVGRGNSVRFWLGKWTGELPLTFRFSRLFVVELNKNCFIKDKITFSCRSLSLVWEWRHSPRGREISEFEELLLILKDLSPFFD